MSNGVVTIVQSSEVALHPDFHPLFKRLGRCSKDLMPRYRRTAKCRYSHMPYIVDPINLSRTQCTLGFRQTSKMIMAALKSC